MYKSLKIALAVMILVGCMSLTAYAGNKYSDEFTTEDGNGHWTFTSMESGKTLESATVLAATPATLTTATSGETYIADAAPAGATGATIITVVLPVAADQLVYKFITGDGSVLVLETTDSNSTDIISYGAAPAKNTSLRSTAATGATIEVHGDGDGLWYVSNVVGTWTPETKT